MGGNNANEMLGDAEIVDTKTNQATNEIVERTDFVFSCFANTTTVDISGQKVVSLVYNRA